MGLFGLFKNNQESTNGTSGPVWRDANGKIRCLGDACPQECDDTCPIYLNTQAMMMIMSGKNTKAIPMYEKAIKLAPDFYDAWNNLASIYGSNGNHEKAYECYSKAHECDPDNFHPLFGLAVSSKNLEKYDECIEWCDKYEAVTGDGRTNNIREYVLSMMEDDEEDEDDDDGPYVFPESTEDRRAVAIVTKLLQDELTPEIMDYRGGLPNIPEIMMQALPVCNEINNAMNDEADDFEEYITITPIWCAYAGMGATAMWNDDWPKLRDKGIIESLTEERGYFAMDEFVTDYIGVGWDSEESKKLRGVLQSHSYGILDEAITEDGKFDMTYYREATKAMYIYGMVYEMSRLGMH